MPAEELQTEYIPAMETPQEEDRSVRHIRLILSRILCDLIAIREVDIIGHIALIESRTTKESYLIRVVDIVNRNFGAHKNTNTVDLKSTDIELQCLFEEEVVEDMDEGLDTEDEELEDPVVRHFLGLEM